MSKPTWSVALLILALLYMSCAGALQFYCYDPTDYRLLKAGETGLNLLWAACGSASSPLRLNYSLTTKDSSGRLTYILYNLTAPSPAGPVFNKTFPEIVGGATTNCESLNSTQLGNPPVGTVYGLSLSCAGAPGTVCHAYYALVLRCGNASTDYLTISGGSGEESSAAAVTPLQAST